MGINNYITDPKNHKNAHVFTLNDKDNSNAIVSATHPLKMYENQIEFFTNKNYGIDMNIGSSTENYEYIHNGTDNTYWTASEIGSGKFTFDSTDQSYDGTKSIKYDNGNLNDILQLTKSSNISLINYDYISIWIYVDRDWKAGDSIEIYGWDTNSGIVVGNSVKLEDYFTWNIFNTWHKVAIPLKDMSLIDGTLDALRIEIIASEEKTPIFYMDSIQFEGLSSLYTLGEYYVKPELGTWYYPHKMSISMADNIDGIITVAGATENATLPGISYDKFLGESSLSTGIVYQEIHDNIITQTLLIKNIGDFLIYPSTNISTCISDGTNTFLTMDLEFTEPLILKSENDDKLKIIITEDLSGLSLLRISVGGKKEQRT